MATFVQTITLTCNCLLNSSATETYEITEFWEPSELPRQQHPKFGCHHEALDRRAARWKKFVKRSSNEQHGFVRVLDQKQHWFSRAPPGRATKLGDFRGQNRRTFDILGELTDFTFLSTNAELTKNKFSFMIKLSTMFQSENPSELTSKFGTPPAPFVRLAPFQFCAAVSRFMLKGKLMILKSFS